MLTLGLMQGRLSQGLASIARWLALVGVLGLSAVAPGSVWAQKSCAGSLDPTITQPSPSYVGATVKISLEIRTGGLQGATAMTVDRVRYKLDCTDDGLFPLCVDEGTVLTFTNGTETTNCTAGGHPVAVDCELDVNDPNSVDCDLTPDVTLPPNNAAPCSVSFNTLITSMSTDATPNAIEGAATVVGSCNNGLPASMMGTAVVLVSPTTPFYWAWLKTILKFLNNQFAACQRLGVRAE
jgi:hypothetical protein